MEFTTDASTVRDTPPGQPARQARGGVMLIPLNLARDQPLQQQLHDQLRELIGGARLRPGARMPSTRMLAEQFGISRITVLLTYERLIAEGYLETLPAKGTFVAQLPPRLACCHAGPSVPCGTGRATPRSSRGSAGPTPRCSPPAAGAA